MEQRDVVAPAAGGERVERRPRLGHAAPAPEHRAAAEAETRCACTSSKPASRRRRAAAVRASARRSRGCCRRGSARPRASPARSHDRRAGRPKSTQRSQATRGTRPGGTPKSSSAAVAPRSQHSPELAQARRQVIEIAEQVGGGQAVEGGILEGQFLGGSFDQPHALRLGRERDRRRASASISPLWSTPTTEQPFCPTSSSETAAGAAGDVEHGVVRPNGEARDEEAPPARVLTEREHVCVAVVGRPERREEPARDPGPGLCHAVSLSSPLGAQPAGSVAWRRCARSSRRSPREAVVLSPLLPPTRTRGSISG